jgi:hypothetical protein
MVSIPLALLTLITVAVGAYHMGYARGEEKLRRIVLDHRDGMNAKFNCMKLEAQEKLRQQREGEHV